MITLVIGNAIYFLKNLEIRQSRNKTVSLGNSFVSFSSDLDVARRPLDLLPLGHTQLDSHSAVL